MSWSYLELKGLPGSAVNVPGPSSDFRTEAPLTTIPGLENEGQQHHQQVGQPPAVQTQGGKIEAQFRSLNKSTIVVLILCFHQLGMATTGACSTAWGFLPRLSTIKLYRNPRPSQLTPGKT
ncbi:hypothetical protein MUK42_12704 [Musa troglodytarum]|uniref:Uncharacterized protein n=1 Tax=Musa troglodytarum TaxID=320322 RepID=A0A9E7GRZ8_9LILI|nr:hypothetical protein MUK42_12704 [Musa troglodytarum]